MRGCGEHIILRFLEQVICPLCRGGGAPVSGTHEGPGIGYSEAAWERAMKVQQSILKEACVYGQRYSQIVPIEPMHFRVE